MSFGRWGGRKCSDRNLNESMVASYNLFSVGVVALRWKLKIMPANVPHTYTAFHRPFHLPMRHSSETWIHEYSSSPWIQLVTIVLRKKFNFGKINRLRIPLRAGNFITVIDFHSSHIYSTCVDSSFPCAFFLSSSSHFGNSRYFIGNLFSIRTRERIWSNQVNHVIKITSRFVSYRPSSSAMVAAEHYRSSLKLNKKRDAKTLLDPVAEQKKKNKSVDINFADLIISTATHSSRRHMCCRIKINFSQKIRTENIS